MQRSNSVVQWDPVATPNIGSGYSGSGASGPGSLEGIANKADELMRNYQKRRIQATLASNVHSLNDAAALTQSGRLDDMAGWDPDVYRKVLSQGEIFDKAQNSLIEQQKQLISADLANQNFTTEAEKRAYFERPDVQAKFGSVHPILQQFWKEQADAQQKTNFTNESEFMTDKVKPLYRPGMSMAAFRTAVSKVIPEYILKNPTFANTVYKALSDAYTQSIESSMKASETTDRNNYYNASRTNVVGDISKQDPPVVVTSTGKNNLLNITESAAQHQKAVTTNALKKLIPDSALFDPSVNTTKAQEYLVNGLNYTLDEANEIISNYVATRQNSLVTLNNQGKNAQTNATLAANQTMIAQRFKEGVIQNWDAVKDSIANFTTVDLTNPPKKFNKFIHEFTKHEDSLDSIIKSGFSPTDAAWILYHGYKSTTSNVDEATNTVHLNLSPTEKIEANALLQLTRHNSSNKARLSSLDVVLNSGKTSASMNQDARSPQVPINNSRTTSSEIGFTRR